MNLSKTKNHSFSKRISN